MPHKTILMQCLGLMRTRRDPDSSSLDVAQGLKSSCLCAMSYGRDFAGFAFTSIPSPDAISFGLMGKEVIPRSRTTCSAIRIEYCVRCLSVPALRPFGTKPV